MNVTLTLITASTGLMLVLIKNAVSTDLINECHINAEYCKHWSITNQEYGKHGSFTNQEYCKHGSFTSQEYCKHRFVYMPLLTKNTSSTCLGHTELFLVATCQMPHGFIQTLFIEEVKIVVVAVVCCPLEEETSHIRTI